MAVNSFPQLSHRIIGCCFKGHNSLGGGLPESVYHKALEIEFRACEIPFVPERYFPVYYRGLLAGQFYADLVVDDRIILELKSSLIIREFSRSQLRNYFRLSGLRVGYVINFFNNKVEFDRFVV